MSHTSTRRVQVHLPVPVDDYLRTQGRFRHLFEPRRADDTIARIQAAVDEYWARAG